VHPREGRWILISYFVCGHDERARSILAMDDAVAIFLIGRYILNYYVIMYGTGQAGACLLLIVMYGSRSREGESQIIILSSRYTVPFVLRSNVI
jgi:hypothetical protein